jgi:hypothetical protein
MALATAISGKSLFTRWNGTFERFPMLVDVPSVVQFDISVSRRNREVEYQCHESGTHVCCALPVNVSPLHAPSLHTYGSFFPVAREEDPRFFTWVRVGLWALVKPCCALLAEG